MCSEMSGKLAAPRSLKGCPFRVQLVAFFKSQCLGQGAPMSFVTQLDVGWRVLHSVQGGHCVRQGKPSNPELPWLAQALGSRNLMKFKVSLIQSPASGIADCQGCSSLGKNLGPWPMTNQICVNRVCLCQERSASLCYISKRADSRLREVSVPSCEREKVFEVLSPVWGLMGDSSREASPAEF